LGGVEVYRGRRREAAVRVDGRNETKTEREGKGERDRERERDGGNCFFPGKARLRLIF